MIDATEPMRLIRETLAAGYHYQELKDFSKALDIAVMKKMLCVPESEAELMWDSCCRAICQIAMMRFGRDAWLAEIQTHAGNVYNLIVN